MAYYNKIGLLILNDDQTKFLVCEPGSAYEEKKVTQYLMPGGQVNGEESDENCLRREIGEELSCEIEAGSLSYLGEFTDLSAAGPDRDVTIKLYQGKVGGRPVASAEIGRLVWVGKNDLNNIRVSPIIKNKIIPYLMNNRILK